MIFHDIETYSECDLIKSGAYKYAEHRSTEVMLLSYCIDDGPLKTIDFTTRISEQALWGVIQDFHGHELVAHNAAFERTIFNAQPMCETDLARWHCTMVLSLTLGLPGKLETVCDALGFGDDLGKIKEGKKLINRFCKPAPKNHKATRYTRETHPEEWQRFIEYCERDAELVRELWHRLPHTNYDTERQNWLLDQTINDRGLPIDTDLAEAAIALTDETLLVFNEELAELTDHAVTATSQTAKMRDYLDMGIQSLAKDLLPELIERAPTERQRRVLEIRQLAGKTSTSKYAAAINGNIDGRLHGTLQFYGARTGRWSGRQIQPQNMPRPTMKDIGPGIEAIKAGVADLLYDDVIGLTSSCVRGVIAAGPGKKLVVSDLSNIEGRILAWLAGAEWKLQAFRDFDDGSGPDLYNLAYARTFNKDVSRVTGDQRQIGKVIELALGYQGAVGAFSVMASAYGVNLPEEEILIIVKAFRKVNVEIVNLWYRTQDTAIKAVKNKGMTFKYRSMRWSCQEKQGYTWLFCKLPSGRYMCYFDPKIKSVFNERFKRNQDVLSFMGVEMPSYRYTRIDTYGGKLVENITQACARDVMAEGMHLAEWNEYPSVLTVHDELVTECADNDEWDVAQLSEFMVRVPEWCGDLPLAAAGYESKFYKKD